MSRHALMRAHADDPTVRHAVSWRRPVTGLVAVVALLLSTIALAITPAGAAPALNRVALLASAQPTYTADVQTKLSASGAFDSVTTLSNSMCSATTPSLQTLQQYDEVYAWADCPFADKVGLGNVLADYVDGGGRVVISTFSTLNTYGPTGRLVTGGYLPTTIATASGFGQQSLVANLPDNPLLAGVTRFDGGGSSYHGRNMTVTDGSTLVASWTDGSPLVAYRSNVVMLNFYPPSSTARADFWDATSDGTRLMVNALNGRTTRAPAVTSDDHATFRVGTAGSFTITTSGAPNATLTETGDLPSGVTFTDNGNGTATLAGTPDASTGGSYPITVTAANSVSPDATQTFTLTVNDVPAISSIDHTAFEVGAAHTFTVTTTAGYPAATTITEDGDLPSGVTFTDNGDGTATLGGTPAAGTAGSYPVTVTATNSTGSSTQSFTASVSLAGQTVQFTSTPPRSSGVVGQTYAVTASGGGSSNPVTFSVDSSSTDVCTISGTTVTLTHPGSCVIDAAQAGDGRYASGSASQTVVVTKAATNSSVTVRPTSLSATVAPVAPGAGSPTGTVTFSVDGKPVGAAPVDAGTATLAYRVTSGQSRRVAAVYAGNADFAGSSDSTARRDPSITARITSATAKTAAGWYRTPVTVTFRCTSPGAPLTRACPAPVTFSRSAAGRSVTRTVTATDGGADTITVSGINVDRSAPKVTLTGVRNGATYPGQAPAARCVAGDALSGVARCSITRHASGESVRVTATATDRAGNTRTTSVRYTVARFYIAGATYRHGAYQVREGRTYTVVALTNGTARPQYYNAAPHGTKPAPRAASFTRSGSQAGLHRFTLAIRIDRNLDRYRLWDMGVKTGGTLHRITFDPAR